MQDGGRSAGRMIGRIIAACLLGMLAIAAGAICYSLLQNLHPDLFAAKPWLDGAANHTGMLIGALLSLVCVAIVAIVGSTGATPGLATKFAASGGSLWTWFGGLAGVTLVLGLIGLFIGKASE